MLYHIVSLSDINKTTCVSEGKNFFYFHSKLGRKVWVLYGGYLCLLCVLKGHCAQKSETRKYYIIISFDNFKRARDVEVDFFITVVLGDLKNRSTPIVNIRIYINILEYEIYHYLLYTIPY